MRHKPSSGTVIERKNGFMPRYYVIEDGARKDKYGQLHKTKKEAVTAALREYVKRRKQVKIIGLAGTIDYDRDYDYKALRRKRPR